MVANYCYSTVINKFLSILSNKYICQMTISGGILRGVSVSECKMIEAEF